MEIDVTLLDGTIRRVQQGTTIGQLAISISTLLGKKAVAGKMNGWPVDLNQPIIHQCDVEIVTLESKDGIDIYRHTTAHIMAQAIKRLYGNCAVKLAIGPVIDDGFYYDLDLVEPLSTNDLLLIEQEMKKIINENLPIVRQVISREEAIQFFEAIDETFKVEIIHGLPNDAELSLYTQGEFTDLCRGPHLPSTGHVKAFKLLNVAGAYWRGDSNNKMLQRVYGTSFPKKAQLDEYLYMLEEAKKRDHRKLGRELDLFMFSDEAPGMPFFLPKGMILRTELENLTRGIQQSRDYDEVRSPLMLNNRLWEQSGHWEHYKDNMYFTEVDTTTFALKPMNCPGHMIIYKSSMHSYREFPIRLFEFGQVHRHEYSGALNGMLRVRTFCQDDAHIFVLPDQIEDEIGRVIQLIDDVYRVFGFQYRIELSTRPEEYMGTKELWDQAEQSLAHVLNKRGIDYRINHGDGAFYGPKIDFHILDALKRSWQCGTIQLDFQMPDKFDLTYIGEDGYKHRPVVIHRAVYGSIDRFMGIITEHYAGAFPVWLSPVQVKVLPVSERYHEYAEQVKRDLAASGIRAEVDQRDEKLGYKIREAQLQKVPYMFILGEKELASLNVSVRQRGIGDAGMKNIHEIKDQILEDIRNRTI